MKKDIKTNWRRLYSTYGDILLFINENPKTPVNIIHHKFGIGKVDELWADYDLIDLNEMPDDNFFYFLNENGKRIIEEFL